MVVFCYVIQLKDKCLRFYLHVKTLSCIRSFLNKLLLINNFCNDYHENLSGNTRQRASDIGVTLPGMPHVHVRNTEEESALFQTGFERIGRNSSHVSRKVNFKYPLNLQNLLQFFVGWKIPCVRAESAHRQHK